MVAFIYYQQEFMKIQGLNLCDDEYDDYLVFIPCYCCIGLLHNIGLKNTTFENDLYLEVENQIKKRLSNCFLINKTYFFNKDKFKDIAGRLIKSNVMKEFLKNIVYFLNKYNEENLRQEELLFNKIQEIIKGYVAVEIVDKIDFNNLGRYLHKENKILIMKTNENNINIWIHEFIHFIQYQMNPSYYNQNKLLINLQAELEAMIVSEFILRKFNSIWYKTHFASYEYFYSIINEYNQNKIFNLSERKARKIIMGTQPIIEKTINVLGLEENMKEVV